MKFKFAIFPSKKKRCFGDYSTWKICIEVCLKTVATLYKNYFEEMYINIYIYIHT